MSPGSQITAPSLEKLMEIRARIPDKIPNVNDSGGFYILADADKIALSQVDEWSDNELEEILYIMTPLETNDPLKEQQDLLKYLNMERRVYELMLWYMTLVMETRNKERTSLKRINPTKRKWRRPEL